MVVITDTLQAVFVDFVFPRVHGGYTPNQGCTKVPLGGMLQHICKKKHETY